MQIMLAILVDTYINALMNTGGSVEGIHMRDNHGESSSKIENCFSILRKCRGKYECLLYEMLYIRELKPSLNTQSDSIRSKLFA